MVLGAGVHVLHQHGAFFGQQDGVEVLGQRGFAAAVGAQHRHKFAPPHLHGHPVHRVAGLLRVIAELYVLHIDHGIFQKSLPLYSLLSHIAVAPQGTVPPVALTGRPISSHQVVPPATGERVVFRIYSITAGLRPSV